MPRLPKNKTIILQSSQKEFDVDFYRSYDASALYHKALALCFALQEYDRFCAFVESPAVTGEEMTDTRCEDALRAELFFTFMHQFESYFALLRAPYQDKAHWLYMAHYDPGDVERWARAFIDDDMEKLAGDPSLTRPQFVQDALYLGSVPSETDLRQRWQENLDNVVLFLERVAGKYLDGLDAYNAYKHGLRTMTGTAFLSITRMDESGERRGVGWQMLSDDTLTYLGWEAVGTDKIRLNKVTRFFSPKECFFYLAVLYQMAETTMKKRLAFLEGVTEPQRINTFLDLDEHEILQDGEIRQWTIPI